ncbi:MAG: porin [Planctomycetaceae bacterium]|jgi:hypothetical protein|nr:porin [Planctomycetaceae bacterium]
MKKNLLGCFGVIATLVVLQFTQTETHAGLFDNIKPCDEVGECNPCDNVCDDVAVTDCDPCGEIDVCNKKKSKWFVTGYLEAGFFANEYGQKNVYAPKEAGFSHNTHDTVKYGNGYDTLEGRWRDWNLTPKKPLQNVSNTGGQLNQLYISLGKSVDGRYGWDLGGTVDFTFGTDAEMVQSAGLEYDAGHGPDSWGTGDYYSAFAQAYFEAAYKKWNFKAGKFYLPFGSNEYESTQRFFYSLPNTFEVVPETAGGALANYTVNDRLSISAGWIQPNQFGESAHDNAFLGGINFQATKKLNLHYVFAIGKDTASDIIKINKGTETQMIRNNANYFINSFVATYQFNKKWKYTFDWSLKNFNNEHESSTLYWEDLGSFGDEIVRIMNYGINNELIYRYNSKWAFGVRACWGHSGYSYHDQDPTFGGDYFFWTYQNRYSFSLGANWTPTKWLIVKPELRYDVYDLTRWDCTADYHPTEPGHWGRGSRQDKPFNNGKNKDQFAGGVSAIVKF